VTGLAEAEANIPVVTSAAPIQGDCKQSPPGNGANYAERGELDDGLRPKNSEGRDCRGIF
jgi:hypothetical protein